MTRKCVLSLDQGSSSSRAMVFDEHGKIRAQAQVKLPTLFPKPGWVEHDPKQILSSQLSAIQQVLNKLGSQKKRLVGLAITNQRSTLLIWDRKTGSPVVRAISWQDRRASDLCKSIGRSSHRKRTTSHENAALHLIRRKTGLRLTPYYAAPKLAWLLEQTPGLRKRAENGDLLCGTVNSYLIWHLTNRKVHITDHTNAARMLLMNLSHLEWDPELLNLFGIPRPMLARIVPTCDYFGEAQIGKERIPIFCSIGDQQAATLGLGSIEKGNVTLNYGTGGFVLLNTGNDPKFLPELLTGIAWSSPKKVSYLLEGTVNSVGSAMEWLREGLGLFKQYHELPHLYRQSRHRMYVIPSIAGLGAPHWREDVPTQFFNLNRNTKRADLIRGTIEGIAFLINDIVQTMIPVGLKQSVRVSAGGGIARIDPLLQFQADLLRAPIKRHEDVQSTCLGAAFLAGLACGIWTDPIQIRELIRTEREFKPQLNRQEVEGLKRSWKKVLRLALQWSDP